MEDRPAHKSRKPWLPVLVTLTLLAGLGGWVGWHWHVLEQRAWNEQQGRFAFEVDHIESRLRERMQAYEMVLRGLAGLVAANDVVRPEGWLRATDQLDLLNIYPGIQAVNLARYARRSDLQTQLEEIRGTDRAHFQYFPPGDREEYMLVELTHPRSLRNQQVLGFDLFSEGVRREAILRARLTGEARLTGPLRLRQDVVGSVQTGVLLFLPLYAIDRPLATVEERQAAFRGTLYGAFRLDDLMHGLFGSRNELFHLQVVDAETPGLHLLSEQKAVAHSPLLREVRHLPLYGRTWQLTVASTPAYETGLDRGNRLLGLAASLLAVLLFSLLVGGYLWLRERALSASRTLSLQLHEREARFRLLIEQLPVATLLCDERGAIELANQSAAQLLNGQTAEVLGQPVTRYLPAVQVGGRDDYRVPQGAEVMVRRSDGGEVPVTLSLTRLSLADEVHFVLNLFDLRDLKRVEERFRSMVEGLPNAFVLVDREGLVVMINRQTELLFGYSREELLGRSVDLLLPEAQRERHVTLRDSFFSQPEPLSIGNNREVYGQHRDGHLLPLELGLAPLRSGDEMLVQAVLVDIRHRKAAELRLRDQADQLALASRYKSEFLANMSHELRTPLNSILLLSDQLKRNAGGNLTDKQVRHADIIYRAGQDLLQLINDVLDMSRIETGRLQLELEPFELHAFLREIEDSLRPMAEQKGLRLSTWIASEVPGTLVSDRMRLQQILRNLLSNALKFTEHGMVDVRVDCTAHGEPEPRRYLRLQVCDTGIGIPPAEHERIFQAFQQIDGSISRRYGGAGLGLAITRQLVGVLGGEIRVASEAGQGACFTVEIPLSEATSTTVEELPTAGLEAELLMIGDDPFEARLIMDVGKTYGFSGLHCSTLDDVAEALRQRRFKVVVLDIRSPAFDGRQVYRLIRGDERHLDVPLLLLGDMSDIPDPSDNSLRLLSKPVTQGELQRLFLEMARHDDNPKQLLLVATQPVLRQRLRDHCEQLGYSVTLTARSDEARLAFAEQTFTVLLIDFDLSDENGVDLIEALYRLRPFSQETRVIVFSEKPVSAEIQTRLRNYAGVAVGREDLETRLDTLLAPISNDPVTTAEVSGLPLLGRRVLLVDTDVRSIFVLSALLDELGLQATPAVNTDEALQRFQEAAFDLLLLDASSIADAAGLIRRLREDYACQVPIICLGGVSDELQAVTGADDCLVKPVERDRLAALIRHWLGRTPGAESSE